MKERVRSCLFSIWREAHLILLLTSVRQLVGGVAPEVIDYNQRKYEIEIVEVWSC